MLTASDGRGGEGREKEPNHTKARKPGTLQYIEYSLVEYLGYAEQESKKNCRNDVLQENQMFTRSA